MKTLGLLTPWWVWFILSGISGLEANDAYRRELLGRAALWSVVAILFDVVGIFAIARAIAQ